MTTHRRITTVTRVSSNSSRFGVRGTESLGGGLNAIFQIEQNINGDGGNSSVERLASRETFVGLQGSWGRFTLGKFLMPMDDLHPIFGNAPTLTTSMPVDGRTCGPRQPEARARAVGMRVPATTSVTTRRTGAGFTFALQARRAMTRATRRKPRTAAIMATMHRSSATLGCSART